MIKIENLRYVYQEGMPFSRTALDDINLTINSGEFVAIIGHTGSGKSTLIQHLNGLMRTNYGRILIDGVDISDKNTNLKKVREQVGLVFQYPEHQLFEETVYRDIAFGPLNMGLSAQEVKDRVYSAIEVVGIGEELLDKSPFELSGGQKRRVAIAGVLAMNPKILILDEPTASLDPHGREKIIKVLENIHKADKEKTIIFVSHSMEEVARLAEKVVVLDHGKIAMSGTVAEVFSKGDELLKLGLNVPQVTRLFLELKKCGIDVADGVFTLEGAYSEILKKLSEVQNV